MITKSQIFLLISTIAYFLQIGFIIVSNDIISKRDTAGIFAQGFVILYLAEQNERNSNRDNK